MACGQAGGHGAKLHGMDMSGRGGRLQGTWPEYLTNKRKGGKKECHRATVAAPSAASHQKAKLTPQPTEDTSISPSLHSNKFSVCATDKIHSRACCQIQNVSEGRRTGSDWHVGPWGTDMSDEKRSTAPL